MWKNLDQFEAPSLRAGIRRLEGVVAQGIPYATTLIKEKYIVQSSLLEASRDPSGFFEIGDSDSSTANKQGTSRSVTGYLIILRHGKRGLMENLTEGMDQMIREAGQPYRDAQPVPVRDRLTDIFLGVFPKGRVRYEAGEAQNALLLAAMALRAYRLEKGSYPGSLDALVTGGYLSKVPRDPFGGADHALRCRRTESGFLLYSLGPDGKDDGGEPIDNPAAEGNARRNVMADSKGDVVAGVNF
jgi:hypothetical protein